jgi:hypothetical protein
LASWAFVGIEEEALQREVELLAGPRYARKDGAPDRVWWGRQRESVYLLDQKMPVRVPLWRAAGGWSGPRRWRKGVCGESCTGSAAGTTEPPRMQHFSPPHSGKRRSPHARRLDQPRSAGSGSAVDPSGHKSCQLRRTEPGGAGTSRTTHAPPERGEV